MSPPTTRTQAKRRTLLAQGVALVLLVGGVAVGITGLPEQSLPTPGAVNAVNGINPTSDNLSTPSSRTNTPTAATRVHVSSIAQRLSMVDNAPEAPVVETVVDESSSTDPEPPVETNAAIVKRLRYIGYVAETGSHAAFVRLDGAQRIIREGGVLASSDEFLEDLTIKTIRPNYLIATDGVAESRVMLGTRSGPSITMANGNEITAAETPAVKVTPEYDEAILGDPSKMPKQEIDRRRRQLERALRNESPRSEESRLREPPVTHRAGLNQNRNRNRGNDD